MILRFPNFDTLKLAITSGVVPEKVWSSKAESVFEEDGTVLIKSAEKLAKTVGAELKKLGVTGSRKFPANSLKLACWLQAFPLERAKRQSEDWSGQHGTSAPAEEQINENSTVLFHLQGQKNLPDLVSEILRLGNDRQSFRYLETSGKQPFANKRSQDKKEPSAFLRVIGPPYYSMLRALEENHSGSNGSAQSKNASASSGITAYVETCPRVWIQFGYEHPVGVQLTPPPGKWLFVQPDHSWLFIDEAPFKDIYQSIEFGMPNVTTDWVDAPLKEKINVSVNLARGSSGKPADMWVIRKNGMAQVEKILNESSDPIVKRLAFAVCETEGEEPCVILRVRPPRKNPPVLVIDGMQLSAVDGIPNLFLPIGTRVHPPLRRDAVVDLLAPDAQQVIWLEQEFDGEPPREFLKSSFKPYSVPDSAFRPLSDWMEYVLDFEQESLSTWIGSFQFDFEKFVCDDDKKNKPKKKGPPKVVLKGNKSQSAGIAESETKLKPETAKEKKTNRDVDFSTEQVPLKERNPGADQVALKKAEDKFLAFEGSLDDPGRLPFWRKMGELNGRLEHRHDATVCWCNAVWNVRDKETLRADYKSWLESEIQSSKYKSFSARELDEFCKDKSTRPLDASLVVAFLVWASEQETMPEGLAERLNEVAQFVERQEGYLPIRTVWLAWNSLFKLSGNDTLMLARARDRVLQRLFDQGLPAEYDMPSFLRARGIGQSDRFKLILSHVKELQDLVIDWVENPVVGNPKTTIYAQLMFAFAFAKLGEITEAKTSVIDAIEGLKADDPIHNWLGNAFEYRVTQALNGKSSLNQLSPELVDRLDALEKMDRYKVDRLRSLSRILEPHERINAFTQWHNRHVDKLAEELSGLPEEKDTEKLRQLMTRLLEKHKKNHGNYGRVLTVAMELAPRVGDDFASHLFDEVIDWLNDKKAATMDKASLLQKSMYVAAHFDRVDAVQSYVSLFENSLSAIVSEYLALQSNYNTPNKEKVDAIESLFTESFRGLRKLGMREEIGRLYSGVEALIEKHEPGGKKSRQAKNSKTEIDGTRPLRLLLCVASGWYYFGQEIQAGAIAKQVGKVVFKKDMPAVEQKDLACAYVNSVSHALVYDAITMIRKLFARKKNGDRELANVKDNMTTSSHFSVSQLALIETTVMALVSDDFTLDDESRRWLDEDEFLVRSRIHDDVRQAMK